MSADVAIDRFFDVAEQAGARRPDPPADTVAVDEIEAAIAPLRLPAAARRLWERIDLDTMPVEPFPSLCSPQFALDSWRSHDERPGMVPRVLFPLCYSSWSFVFVELHGPDDELGGTLFSWDYGGGDFTIAFDGVEDWLDVHAAAIDAGEAELEDGALHLEMLDATVDGATRLERRGPHPVYGSETSVADDAVDWPERWLRLSGLEPADWTPQGSTHTIAEVRKALDGDGRVRVHAEVKSVDDFDGWTRAKIADGSGKLVVECPPEASAFGPRNGDRFEFELVAAGGAGEVGGGILGRLRPMRGPQAKATAVRPLRGGR